MDALLNYRAQESTIADVNSVTTESTPSPYNCAKRTVSQPESYCTSFPLNWMTFTTASQSSTHTLQVRGRVESKSHRAAAWEKTQVNTLSPDAGGNKGGSDKQRSIRSNREEDGEETH